VSRRGLAGYPARLALHGRHVSELTHELHAAIAGLTARREREFRTLRLRLEAADLRRRLAAIRGRVTSADGRLHSAIRRRHDRAHARVVAAAGRLHSLSPLAVLGRGYAVCWNDDHTAIVRSADTVSAGDRVHVTLENGELDCRVDRVAEGRRGAR
jgi:exodeoxyribonuclease VII large subunit